MLRRVPQSNLTFKIQRQRKRYSEKLTNSCIGTELRTRINHGASPDSSSEQAVTRSPNYGKIICREDSRASLKLALLIIKKDWFIKK